MLISRKNKIAIQRNYGHFLMLYLHWKWSLRYFRLSNMFIHKRLSKYACDALEVQLHYFFFQSTSVSNNHLSLQNDCLKYISRVLISGHIYILPCGDLIFTTVTKIITEIPQKWFVLPTQIRADNKLIQRPCVMGCWRLCYFIC